MAEQEHNGDQPLWHQDRRLWDSGPGSHLTSGAENERVRLLLVGYLDAEVQRRCGDLPADHPAVKRAYGAVRGQVARRWVQIAEDQGLKMPGEPARADLRVGGMSVHEKHVDAARTRIRHILEGTNQYAWATVGVEAAVCSLTDRPLPPAADARQERIF